MIVFDEADELFLQE